MSVKIMNRVFQSSKQKGSKRLALICIADNADDNGIAFPGVATTAKKMGGVSRRTAGNLIEAMSKTTELGVYARKGNRHDYIIFVDMTISQAKLAIRALMIKRRLTVKQMRDLRKSFATTRAKVSQVPAKKSSLVPAKKLRQEPSVKPSGTTSKDGGDRPNIFRLYESMLGLMVSSDYERETLLDWEKTYSLEWVKDAFQEAADNNVRKISYVKSILTRWKSEGRKDNRAKPNSGSVKPEKPSAPYQKHVDIDSLDPLPPRPQKAAS